MLPQLKAMSNHDYRTALYEHYASGLSRAESDLSNDAGRQPYFEQLVSRHLPNRSARILELGAGSGALLTYLRSQGFAHITGIDGSPEQVALAQQRGVDVQLGDVLDALRDADTGSHDVIIALDVIEHFDKEEAFTLVQEIARVLTPEGRCIIHTVNADSPFFGSIRYGDFTHETAFNRSSITQVLTTVGFQRVACFEDRPVVHGLKSFARSVIWAVARNTATLVLAAETGVLSRDRILSQNFLTVADK